MKGIYTYKKQKKQKQDQRPKNVEIKVYVKC